MKTMSELLWSGQEAEKRSSELLSLFYKPLSEDEFSFRIERVIPYIDQINEKMPHATMDRFIQVIQREYNHYLDFCNLLKNKKINIIHTVYDSNFKKIRFHGIIDNSQPECDIYKEQVIIHPPLIRNASLMIPRRYFKKDNLDVGLISYHTELLHYIANSWTNTALRCIHDGDYINDYSMEFGYTPLLLAICKGWNHFDDKKNRFTQKPIIEALLAKKSLNVNCIHLKNGMTPLHIACLRGDSPELIKALIARGADSAALDYQGRKPADMLNIGDEEMQAIISDLTGASDYSFGALRRYNYFTNKSEMATVPTLRSRKHYILDIRYCLAKSAVRQVVPNFV